MIIYFIQLNLWGGQDKMFNQQKQNFGIRKFAIGTSSVLLGVTLFLAHGATASAAETHTTAPTDTTTSSSTSSAQNAAETNQNNQDHMQQEKIQNTQDESSTKINNPTTVPPVTEVQNANDVTTKAALPPSENKQANQPQKATTDTTVGKQKDMQHQTSPTSSDKATEMPSEAHPVTTEKQQKSEAPQTNASDKNITPVSTPNEKHVVKQDDGQNNPTPVTTQADATQAKAATMNNVDGNTHPATPTPTQPKDMGTADKTNVATPPRDNTKTTDPKQTITRAAVEQQDNTVDELSSKDMTATIDKKFPAVKYYTLKNGKKVDAQITDMRQIIVNGEAITPNVKYQKIDDHTAEYDLTAQNESRSIDANFKFRLSVIDNTIDLQMTDYTNHNKDSKNVIRNFSFINQSLVSVNSQQKNAKLQTTQMSTNTMKSGDQSYDIDDKFKSDFNDFMMYGFVSNDDYSAGLWSNAQIGVGGAQDFLRVNAQATQTDKGVSVGLGSMPWIIQKDAEHPDAKEQGLLPHVKIAIAEDENQDGVINWQDGAIAYRDIMNNPYGSEEVPDLVGYRIAMNFGSQAQNPFLKTLDGVKKFYLNTDGLGQSILLKGYNSEGHDSGHLDYDNIGQRIGGAKDFNTLLQKGADYGARFGIHVNASETYPEAKAFNPDLLRKKEDGTYMYGWNWLDQGFDINADYDLTHGRQARFEALKKIVGDRLDFIYVDVWGNGQSGDNSAWPSHQLAKEINDLGWRVGVEWGHGMEYDSTFQHWAADLTYGTYQNKGINSEVARFIRNHQKDSWVGHYPSYSGAADFPLLGGYDMKDFEGWQGRNDYAAYIKNIFNVDLPTKFLQHYKVMRIENGEPVKMTANGQTIDWTPEMQVDLQNDAGDKVTVKRKSNDYQNDIDNYRSRTVTLNGQKVLDGDSYLLPWNWDANGQPLTGDKEKLYHWNKKGGSTTWTLPESWQTDQVVLYELTETGRTSPRTVTVKNHQVTLDDIKANTPYVVYKVAQPDHVDVNWSEDTHVKDAGFNSQKLTAWYIDGDKDKVSIEKSETANEMLKIDSPTKTTKLTQQLTGLVPGQRYALYVGTDNRSQSAAHIAVTHNGETLASNQTGQSIARNYVKADAHNNHSETYVGGGSYFQNMYLYFVAPKDGNVDFTIQRDPGEGATYFDDIRVVENDSNLLQNGTFTQDFEKVPQGLFPFVISEAEGVKDNRTHLSEKHAPYTQRGWNNKRVDDVIDGHWSLKINGLTRKNRMIIQTIPQNFYFEPGKTYEVSFDYEAGSDDTYAFATGSGDISKDVDFDKTPLKNTVDGGKAKRVTFKVTGDENGQTWIGIYSTKTPNDPRGVKDGNQINFEGTKDFILDNLMIREVEPPTPENPATQPDHPTTDPNNPDNPTTDPNNPDTTNNGNAPGQTEGKGESTTDTSVMPTEPTPPATTTEVHTQSSTASQGTGTQMNSQGASSSHVNTVVTQMPQAMMNDTTVQQQMMHDVPHAMTASTTLQTSMNKAAMQTQSAHTSKLPATGDTPQNTRGPLMAMLLGAVLTVLGLRRHRKEK